MAIQLKVYANGDHAALVWLPPGNKPIPDCRGFAIRRMSGGNTVYVHGFVGFAEGEKPVNPWDFPVQRFMWWDYSVKAGDTVQYQIVPVVGPHSSGGKLDESSASAISAPVRITGQFTPHISAWFNKGIVASQWVSRELDAYPATSKIKTIVATPGDALRNALSAQLRPRILDLLAQAKANGTKVYLALYELNDPELVAALVALGDNCNLILANGAFKSNTPPDNDENAAIRQQLKTKINVFDRIVGLGHFGHNKFAVFCDAQGKPQQVLTGSTNWTSSGLCTQANNGLVIADPNVAADFLAAWYRLQKAGNDYPPALVSGNSTSQTYQVDGCKVTPWFVETSAAQDLEYARKLINAAEDGIFFLFFNPGTFQDDPKRWTLLQNILERHNPQGDNYDGQLNFCGVVNQDIPQLTTEAGAKSASHDPSKAAPNPVTLYKSGIEPPQRLSHDVLVPRNIKSKFFSWEKELLGASMVNIHSKVIVLDPFGRKPVVMTGSHNLGFKASSKNDDNLVIVEGSAALAIAYAVNIIAIYQNYRWNSYVEANRNSPQVWHGLVDNDKWQNSYLTGADLNELLFWMGQKPVAPAAAAKVAPPKSPRLPVRAPQAHAKAGTKTPATPARPPRGRSHSRSGRATKR